MGDAIQMYFDTNESARTFKDWNASSLCNSAAEQTTFEYFGDLTGSRMVDFGCGEGIFLRQCLAKGASYCLGLDVNEPMISAGGNSVKQSHVNEKLRFAVNDCFKPIEQNYGQFDFATSHYFIHSCEGKLQLEIFLKNVLAMLKPGGKFFISQVPQDVKSAKDQEIVANLLGYWYPIAPGSEPFAPGEAFYPAPASVSKSGRPFTREKLFQFAQRGYGWTKEELMEWLHKMGFVNVALLPASLPDDIPSVEKKQIQGLEEPFGFIGAQRPTTV